MSSKEPNVDKSKTAPIYIQIQNHLLDLIKTGAIKPGEKLPSENALAKMFGTTRSTVVNGFQQLVHSGHIVRQIGRGSFVAHRTIDVPLMATDVHSLEEQLAQQGAPITYRFLRFDLVVPETRLLDILNEADGAELYRLERVRLQDDRPISLEIRHVKKAVGRDMTVSALEKLAFVDILQQKLGLEIGKLEGSIFAVAASDPEASLLNISPGTPLIVRDYVFFDEVGNALSHGVSYYLNEVTFHYSIDSL